LAIVITDLEVIVILAIVLTIVYLIGTYWKHRRLTSYAHWFDENLSPKGKVKFASHGHAGLRIKFEGENDSFKEMHFALTLGARENLMYYPLALVKMDPDRLNCWAILHKPIPLNMQIIKQTDKKIISSLQDNPRLTALDSDALKQDGYVAYSSNRSAALELLFKAAVPSNLKPMHIESVEIDKPSSVLRLVADLRKDTLSDVVKFMFNLASSV